MSKISTNLDKMIVTQNQISTRLEKMADAQNKAIGVLDNMIERLPAEEKMTITGE